MCGIGCDGGGLIGALINGCVVGFVGVAKSVVETFRLNCCGKYVSDPGGGGITGFGE